MKDSGVYTCLLILFSWNIPINCRSASFERFGRQNSPQQSVCATQTCQTLAKSMLDNMDRNVHPCDDFYQFSCGNFKSNTTVAEGQFPISQTRELNEKISEQLRNSIESSISKTDALPFQKLSSAYKSCMDQDQIEKNSQGELIALTKKLGGWPILEKSWNESKFYWPETMVKFHEIGVPHAVFLNARLGPDVKNKSSIVVHLDDTTTVHQRGVLINGRQDAMVKKYHNYITGISGLLGASQKLAEKDIENFLNFEIELVKLQLNPVVARDPTQTYHPTTIKNLQNQCPQVPWLDYFTKILLPSRQLKLSDRVVTVSPSYLTQICTLLSKTPKRILANYAYWGLVSSFVDQLGSKARQLKRQLTIQPDKESTAKQMPRWMECVTFVKSNMHLATSALFVRRYFNSQTKTDAREIIQYVQQSIQQTFKKVDWMDEKTKNTAINKLLKMTSLVAYPDELLDDKKLNDYYKGLVVYQESYLMTKLSLNKFSSTIKAISRNKPEIKLDWTGLAGSSATVNAFYNPADNSFMLLAAILQGIYFNAASPKYANFAGIGFIIAHEMMHGFDDVGHRFDRDGNFQNWWGPETEKIFLNKTRCFIDQYAALGAKKNISINSELCLGENIADSAGMKQAYLAYENWRVRNGDEPRLAGLSFLSPKQTFWVTYANTLCQKESDSGRKHISLIDDPHAHNRLRVLAPLANMPEFSRDFYCPIGSAMNRPDKCIIW